MPYDTHHNETHQQALIPMGLQMFDELLRGNTHMQVIGPSRHGKSFHVSILTEGEIDAITVPTIKET